MITKSRKLWTINKLLMMMLITNKRTLMIGIMLKSVMMTKIKLLVEIISNKQNNKQSTSLRKIKYKMKLKMIIRLHRVMDRNNNKITKIIKSMNNLKTIQTIMLITIKTEEVTTEDIVVPEVTTVLVVVNGVVALIVVHILLKTNHGAIIDINKTTMKMETMLKSKIRKVTKKTHMKTNLLTEVLIVEVQEVNTKRITMMVLAAIINNKSTRINLNKKERRIKKTNKMMLQVKKVLRTTMRDTEANQSIEDSVVVAIIVTEALINTPMKKVPKMAIKTMVVTKEEAVGILTSVAVVTEVLISATVVVTILSIAITKKEVMMTLKLFANVDSKMNLLKVLPKTNTITSVAAEAIIVALESIVVGVTIAATMNTVDAVGNVVTIIEAEDTTKVTQELVATFPRTLIMT